MLALAFPAASSAACSSWEVPPDAVAVVGTTPVLRAELDGLLARAGDRSRSAVDFAVRVLVERQIMRQKADELGIAVTPRQVDARLASFIRTYFHGNRRRYEQRLAEQHLTEAQLRVEISGLLLHDQLLARVTAKVALPNRDTVYTRWWQGVLAEFACRIAYASGYEPS